MKGLTVLKWLHLRASKQVAEHFDSVYVAEFDRQHEWCVAARIEFVLLGVKYAVLSAVDQSRNERQVVFEDGFMQDVFFFLSVIQATAATIQF